MIPAISLIIPVLGEESSINGAIEMVRTLPGGESVEIIVVDGSDDQGTLKAIRYPGVILIPAPRGRGRQMNAGAEAARGRILLFLHADTSLPAKAFVEIINAMKPGKYGAGAFGLSFDNRGFAYRFIAKGANIRTSITGVPYGDQAIFMTRDYFLKLGMYRELPLLEDVDLMKRVKRDGRKIFLSPLQIVTSARRWERDGVIRRTLRNLLIRILYIAGVEPRRLAGFFYTDYREEA